MLAAIFDGLNRYLGNYLGEFVGELCLNAFFILSARAMWRGRILPRWVAGLGLACGALGWIAMWRNVTDVVAPAAALHNAVLPLWMIVFGVTVRAAPDHFSKYSFGSSENPCCGPAVRVGRTPTARLPVQLWSRPTKERFSTRGDRMPLRRMPGSAGEMGQNGQH